MSAYATPGLDTWLTSPSEPRHRYRDRDEHEAALAAEIRNDSDRMHALLEERATEQDESEQVDELQRLRFLLAAPDNDLDAARQLAIYRRDYRALCADLAKAEAALIVDGEV